MWLLSKLLTILKSYVAIDVSQPNEQKADTAIDYPIPQTRPHWSKKWEKAQFFTSISTLAIILYMFTKLIYNIHTASG